MIHRVVRPRVFPGRIDITATIAAEQWLDEICSDGFVPLQVVVKGDDKRTTVSGPEDGCIVLVKR